MASLSNEQKIEKFGVPNFVVSSIQNTLSGRKYVYSHDTYDGFKFRDETNDRTVYEHDLEKYFPLLTPKLTKAGQVAKRQPYIPKQTLKVVAGTVRIPRPPCRWDGECGSG